MVEFMVVFLIDLCVFERRQRRERGMLQATINLLHNKLVYEKLIKLTSSQTRREFQNFLHQRCIKKVSNKRGNSAFQTGIFFPLMVFLCAKFTVHTAELNLKKAMHQFFFLLIFEKSNGFHLCIFQFSQIRHRLLKVIMEYFL